MHIHRGHRGGVLKLITSFLAKIGQFIGFKIKNCSDMEKVVIF
jgi:hypothetical protein